MTGKLKKNAKKIILIMLVILAVFAVSIANPNTGLISVFKVMSTNMENAEISLENQMESNSNTEDNQEISVYNMEEAEYALARSTVEIAEDGAIICQSLMQGVRDCDLEDGTYTFRVVGNIGNREETKNYLVELINYKGDVRYSLDSGQSSKTVSLGDTSKDKKMLFVKYHGNLTIDKGVTLTASAVDDLTYKKGMYICVKRRIIK